MPKRASDIWDQYQVIGGTGNKKHVICIYCNSEYRHSHATRMLKHIIKCEKCPSDIRNRFSKKSSLNNSSNETTASGNNISEALNSRPGTSFSSQSENLNLLLSDDNSTLSLDRAQQSYTQSNQSGVESCNLNRKEQIDANIARAIYASGAPLSLLESKYWLEALKSLNSDYTPPSRHCLSNTLLDAEYTRVKSDIDKKIDLATAVAIITDGWTNINGKGVINFIITTPEPIFFKSVYPECERETAEYLSSEIMKVIEEVGPAKVVALITDNAKNMKAAWRIVQNIYPNITCIGCVAHTLNLIYNDIGKLPTLKNIVDNVSKIIKYIKNKHRALAYFEKVQTSLHGNLKQSLKLPCKTRWNSVVLCLESFQNNKEALKTLAVSEDIDLGNDITYDILHDETWATVKSILKVLKPIYEAVTKSESDNAKVSEVPVIFMRLSACVEDELVTSLFLDDEKEIIRNAINKRRDFCIKPIHLAANLLDPRYMGSGLTSDQEADALNFIHDQARHLGKNLVAVMTNIAEFRTKSAFYAKCHSAWIATETVPPQLWWQSFASKQVLFTVAYRILSIPPSSAAAERNWSLFSNTHTKSRNRLQKERVNKLITVRQNLRYVDTAEDNVEYSSVSEYDTEADIELVAVEEIEDEEQDAESEVESSV